MAIPTPKAVFCDNEGCIVGGKGLSVDLNLFEKLAEMIKTFTPESFGLCTGRSVPYVEAMIQFLGLTTVKFPSICEGGAVLYWPNTDMYELLADPVDKKYIKDAIRHLSYREEPGKYVCFSLYPSPPTSLEMLYFSILNANIPNVIVTRSVAAVDITPQGVDKMFGIKLACEKIGVDLSEVLAIGDSWNDFSMLRGVGFSACPSNAILDVRNFVDYCSAAPATNGVIDILSRFYGNQAQMSHASSVK